jgi:hypothetical protein
MRAQLTTAEAELETAKSTHSAALIAANESQAHLLDHRRRVGSGDSSVVPDDLTVASARAEHAALTVQGAAEALPALDAAVKTARADEFLDDVVRTVPALGCLLADALDAVEEALNVYRLAGNTFDTAVNDATLRLGSVASTSPRVTTQRHGPSRVDHITLAISHADRLLATVVLPAMVSLKAPQFATRELATLASGATPISTD